MELRRNGEKVNINDSLLFTEYKTTDPFIAQADKEYAEYKMKNRKILIEEIERRNAEGSYDV